MVFCYPNCNSTSDGQLGVDFVTIADARHSLNDEVAQNVYRTLIRHERYLRCDLGKTRPSSKKNRIGRLLLSATNPLLQSNAGSTVRGIDCLDNLVVQAPIQVGSASRHLKDPFAVAHLIERRQALLVLIAIVEDRAKDLGFTRAPSFEQFRDDLTPERYERVTRCLYDIARLALPF